MEISERDRTAPNTLIETAGELYNEIGIRQKSKEAGQMDEQKKKIIKAVAADDAKWDNCFSDLASLGYKTNTTFTAYDPPKDPEEKKEYDRRWKEEKSKREG